MAEGGKRDPDEGGLMTGTDDDGPIVRNWGVIGTCYDALMVDPLALFAGRTTHTAFEFSGFLKTDDQRLSYPEGTVYFSQPGGRFDRTAYQMTSMYDYKSTVNETASVTVSDPTGALFSSTLSASYTATRQDTEVHESVVTYTIMLNTQYRLVISDDAPPQLSPELRAALRGLPADDQGSEFDEFFTSFGTHYAQDVTFGGLASQRVRVSRQDYEGFISDGLNLAAQFEGTFDVARGSAKGEAQTQVDEKFKKASSLEVEDMQFIGGKGVQTDFNMWSLNYHDEPGPVKITFKPLYSLLTAQRFPKLADVDARRVALHKATESYLASSGQDTRKQLLRSGDRITLRPIDGRVAGLLQAQTGFVSIVNLDDSVPDAAIWTVHSIGPDSTGTEDLRSGATVELANKGVSGFLDASSGQDGTYSPGDGLVGTKSVSSNATQWVLTLANANNREDIVDGDYVHLQSRWRDTDVKAGFLWCDPKQPLSARQAFSFGKPDRSGSTWRIERLPQ